MTPSISTVTDNSDLTTVTIVYTDTDSHEVDPYGNKASYSTTVGYEKAPNTDDVTSLDNYDYYTKKLLGE